MKIGQFVIMKIGCRLAGSRVRVAGLIIWSPMKPSRSLFSSWRPRRPQ